MARLFELVADEKQIDAGRDLYLHWLPIIEAVFGQRYVAGTKSLLNHMGFEAGPPLPPRLPLTPDDDAEMHRLVTQFALAFPDQAGAARSLESHAVT
jgi:4-hydroxy-tetrahydrodipicolinate synthase